MKGTIQFWSDRSIVIERVVCDGTGCQAGAVTYEIDAVESDVQGSLEPSVLRKCHEIASLVTNCYP